MLGFFRTLVVLIVSVGCSSEPFDAGMDGDSDGDPSWGCRVEDGPSGSPVCVCDDSGNGVRLGHSCDAAPPTECCTVGVWEDTPGSFGICYCGTVAECEATIETHEAVYTPSCPP